MTDSSLLVYIVLFLSIAIVVLAWIIHSLKTRVHEMTRRQSAMVQEQLEKWRHAEIDAIRLQERGAASREADALLQEWKVTHETYFRQDAIARSQAAIVGKVTEHLIPYMPVFPYNPKDARFVGSPVDIIVFDGCDEGALREIVFVEVKTGSSSLSPRQRQIRDAIIAKRVSWRELRLGHAWERDALELM